MADDNDTILAQSNTDAGDADGDETKNLDADAAGEGDGGEAGSSSDDAGKGEGDGGNADGSSDGDDDADAGGAPETYAEFNLPEGVEANEKLTERFIEVSKKLNLSQEAAQEVVDLHFANLTEMGQSQADQLAAAEQSWVESLPNDKEFGGTNYKENLALVAKGVDAVGNAEFKKLMNDTRLGNHPEMVRLLYKVGKMVSEDKFNAGEGEGRETKTAAEVLYPEQSKA